MSNKYSLTYLDNNCLLVVNPKGKIRKIYTPFRVVCIQSVDSIPVNGRVTVEEVLSDKDNKLLFVINNMVLFHSFFKIDIRF